MTEATEVAIGMRFTVKEHILIEELKEPLFKGGGPLAHLRSGKL